MAHGSRRRGLVLLYHRVLPSHTADARGRALAVSLEQFAAQMDVLADSQRVVPLRAAAQVPGEGCSGAVAGVAVSFDDGYADVVEHALPVLQERGIPATVFLTTGFCDGSASAWWEQEVHPRGAIHPQGSLGSRGAPAGEWQAGQPEFLTPAQVGWAARHGLTFENHTHRHPCLASLSEEEVGREVECAAGLIAQWTGRPPGLFAFPRGGWRDISGRALRVLARAGYAVAFASATTSARWYDRLGRCQRPPIRVLRRQPVEWNTPLADFRTWLAP